MYKKKGILLDIHGQGHPEGFIELGYNLTSKNLANFSPDLAGKSSIKKLASLSGQKFVELIRGNTYSLGGIIENNFKGLLSSNANSYNGGVVPSPNHPSPDLNSEYYSGGFISSNYVSASNSVYRLNAIQIELPSAFRKVDFIANSKILANCIFEYYTKNGLGKQN